MRSALVNDTTNVVENVIMAYPQDPSPFGGVYMVGLQDAVYDENGDLVTPGTLCDIGWIYDPVTQTFSAP